MQRLEEIRHTQLADRVRLSLRQAILSGTYRPGERLVEDVIAHQVGVSRSPVREAIRALQHEGLVVSIPRRGAFVTELNATDARNVYTLRAALEVLAAKLVGQQSPPVDLTELDELVLSMEASARERDAARLSELDVRFHQRLVEMSDNDRLFESWSRLLGQVELLSRRVMDTVYADLTAVPGRHQIILDALRGAHVTSMDRVIEEHIHSVSERIVPWLAEGGA